MAGVGIGYFCATFAEDLQDGDCIKATALWAGIGAVAGAGAGAGIDPLFTRAPVARVRVRF